MHCDKIENLCLPSEVAGILVSMQSLHPSPTFSNSPLQRLAITGPVTLDDQSIFLEPLSNFVFALNITYLHLVLGGLDALFNAAFLRQKMPSLQRLAIQAPISRIRTAISYPHLADICRECAGIQRLVLTLM